MVSRGVRRTWHLHSEEGDASCQRCYAFVMFIPLHFSFPTSSHTQTIGISSPSRVRIEPPELFPLRPLIQEHSGSSGIEEISSSLRLGIEPMTVDNFVCDRWSQEIQNDQNENGALLGGVTHYYSYSQTRTSNRGLANSFLLQFSHKLVSKIQPVVKR